MLNRNTNLYEVILNEKLEHYGHTKAAYQFAAEEYERRCNSELLKEIKFLQKKIDFYEK